MPHCSHSVSMKEMSAENFAPNYVANQKRIFANGTVCVSSLKSELPASNPARYAYEGLPTNIAGAEPLLDVLDVLDVLYRSDSYIMERNDLATHASQCVTAFNSCVAISSVLKDNFSRDIEDQRGLFNIWAANANIFARSRASLEYRLREAPRVKSLAQDLLSNIHQTTDYFMESLSAAEIELGPVAELDSNAIQNFLEDTKPFIDVCISSIASDVKLLQKMLKAVRYSSMYKEVKHAASTTQIEKAGLFKAQAEYLVRDRFPDAQKNIVERLVLSMVIRRNRLLYRKRRFQEQGIKLTRITERPQPIIQFEKPSKSKIPVTNISIQQPASNVCVDAKSVYSNDRTATVVDQERYFRYSTPSTVTNPNPKIINTRDFQYPPIPKPFEDGRLLCPYCWLHLTDAETSTQSAWITHLEQDLDQFVCLYETCDLEAEFMLFERRSEWIVHMRNCHQTSWHCQACQQPDKQYSQGLEMENHIRVSHTAAFKTESDLKILVDSCAVQPGRLFESCPLCGITEESQKDMDGHVADHLKGLALTTFSRYNHTIEIDEEPASNSDGTGSNQFATRTTLKELLSLSLSTSRKGWTPPSSEDLKRNPLSTEQLGDLGSREEKIDDARLSNEVDQLLKAKQNSRVRQLQWGFILQQVPEHKSARSDDKINPSRRSFRPTIEEDTILDIKSDPNWLDEEQRELLLAMTSNTLSHFEIPSAPAPRDRNGFQVAIFCALSLEAENMLSMFDVCWEDQGKTYGKAPSDRNSYNTGMIGEFNVVLVHMPTMGGHGAALAAAGLRSSFTRIELALVVGICGVAPIHPVTGQEIILGDVIISTAMVQYDFGRQYPIGIQRKEKVEDSLGPAKPEFRALINMLTVQQNRERFTKELRQLVQSEEFGTRIPTATYPGVAHDRLYEASYLHRHRLDVTCDKCLVSAETCSRNCDDLGCGNDKLVTRHRHKLEKDQLVKGVNPTPLVHFGRFASADTVLKSGLDRDRLSATDEVTAFEMEGAGVWDQYPTIVIKAACDYADSHKHDNQKWQRYAAAMAAGCSRILLKQSLRSKPPTDRDDSFEPIWHVPFDSIPGFVGREVEIRHLHQKLFEPNGHRIVSLLGIGGVGKSRLALELAFQIKSQRPKCWILWVRASNQTTFEKDMLEIGIKLGIPGMEEKGTDIKMLVEQRLSNSDHQWVLILDDAEDPILWGRQTNPGSTQTSLVRYLPKTTVGSILVTTRSGQVASFLAETEVIKLSALTENEALQMFIRSLQKPDLASDQNAVSVLLDRLTYLPLALVQVASHMNRTQQPLQTYVDLIAKSDTRILDLLSEDFGDRSRYPDAVNPVATTWLTSFKNIQKHDPLASELLSRMACFHENGIPQSLLLVDGSQFSNIDVLNAAAILTGYSFVTKHISGGGLPAASEVMYDMHRLVQLAVRNWLKMEDRISTYIKYCTLQLLRLSRAPKHEDENFRKMYLPHARRLCEEIEGENFPEQYELLEQLRLWFEDERDYDEAVKAGTIVMIWRKRVLGEEHPNTLTSIRNLASVFRHQGRFTKAEEMDRQVVEVRERVLGLEHPDTLASMHSLAAVLSDQGKYSEAERIYRQILEVRGQVLDPKHPNTLASMYSLARVISAQGKYSEAEEIYRQVVEVSERVLGLEHPKTQASMHSLARVISAQGKYSEAEEIYRQVVEVSERVLDPKHSNTLASMYRLAELLVDQGKYTEAENVQLRAVRLSTASFGPHDADTQVFRARLQYIWERQGREKSEIEKMLRDVIQDASNPSDEHHDGAR